MWCPADLLGHIKDCEVSQVRALECLVGRCVEQVSELKGACRPNDERRRTARCCCRGCRAGRRRPVSDSMHVSRRHAGRGASLSAPLPAETFAPKPEGFAREAPKGFRSHTDVRGQSARFRPWIVSPEPLQPSCKWPTLRICCRIGGLPPLVTVSAARVPAATLESDATPSTFVESSLARFTAFGPFRCTYRRAFRTVIHVSSPVEAARNAHAFCRTLFG